MPKILVATIGSGPAEDFMTALLPKGLEVYILENHDGIVGSLESIQPDIMVFDVDTPEFGGLGGLGSLKEQGHLEGVLVIVFSKVSGIEFVKQTMALGVTGYLYKPIAPSEIAAQVESLIRETVPGGNKREFVRVKPRKGEQTAVELLLQGSKSVSADVLDVSLGGVALRLRHPERSGSVSIGYSGTVRFFFDDEPNILVKGESVLARGDTLALRFTEVPEDALRVLCRYIHNRLICEDADTEKARGYLEMV